MNNPVDEFGDRLRACREKRGLTQKQLAEHMGMSQRTILQAETHKSNPKFDTVVLLAKEMNISLDALIFPEVSALNAVPKCVYDFFKDKSETDAKRFITICSQIEEIYRAEKKHFEQQDMKLVVLFIYSVRIINKRSILQRL